MNTLAEPQEVLPFERLYIGDSGDASNCSRLKELGITHVFTVAMGFFPRFTDEFEYKQIDILDWDDADIKTHFAAGIEFIDKGREKGGILVHCGAGISRSATMCIAYVMTKDRSPFEAAFRVVANARPWIEPNDGFVAQLRTYQQELGIASPPPPEPPKDDTPPQGD